MSTPTLLSQLKAGDSVAAQPEHINPVKGKVVSVSEGTCLINVVVSQDKSHRQVISFSDIRTINDRFVYTNLARGKEKTQASRFAIDWATQEQLKGEIPDAEIMRQAMEHICSDAGSSRAKLVSSHCRTMASSAKELMALGEYNTLAAIGKEMIKDALAPLDYEPKRLGTVTAHPEFEIEMARYHQVWSKVMALGVQPLRELLTPEGQKQLFGDFDSHKSTLFD